MSKKVVVIGAGFGGMSAAAQLAADGYDVIVLEKNDLPGGRAYVFKEKGYTFDAGPSWYMMPDVFDEFFENFGKKTADYLELKKLDPAYKVVTNNKNFDVSSYPKVKQLISELDPSAEEKFDKFFNETKADYNTVRKSILDLPMQKSKDALNPAVLKYLASKNMYRSYAGRIKSITDNEDLQHTLQFMSVFMGGSPEDVPGVYALLAYVDMGLGVYYPHKGFAEVAKAFEKVCKENGVRFVYNSEVTSIEIDSSSAKSVVVGDKKYEADIVISNADYHHTETKLIEEEYRTYSEKYWHNAKVSPSALLLYLGVNRKLSNLAHHTLFFDTDWDKHFEDIKEGNWNDKPLFYLSTPSLSDDTVAPKGKENLFVLAPMPAGVKPTNKQIETTTKNILKRISAQVGVDVNKHIEVKITKTHEYFGDQFNALRGNAFGMSHTLKQSAIFRPKIKSKKINNLYFVGQYTNPGTGVPMVVLSGKVVANLIKSR